MSSDSIPYPGDWRARLRLARAVSLRLSWLRARPELLGLLGLSAVLNLWGLSINGWANSYYSAAVRSMSTSWHDFLFASLDKSGLMTVDKPPLSLWVQALSARVFGFHPLSLLVPQALMGVLAVGLLYDLVRRHFGRAAGFLAGLTLATTPVIVAVSRHNNPDELLVLCSVATVWLALRALDTGRTRWLVLSGVAVGLGFETKMGVALMVVPGIVAAWLWIAPRGRITALRQLLAAGAAMVLVAGAWPLLVALTPAADRPWVSGTSDNSILSLIFGYNGLGRLASQSGGPGGAGGPGGGGGMGSVFGGATGPFRLLQSGLGDQAGWLLGFAVVAGLALLVTTRLRRSDTRTGFLLVLGGGFVCSAIAFSFAQGIFHPYYVSLLAPFGAAFVGAGAGLMLRSDRAARVLAPLALAGGALTEVVVLNELGGQLSWALPLVIAVCAVGGAILLTEIGSRKRAVVVGVALAALLAAPATWAAETLGHATSGTFPTGGPASASIGRPGGPGGAGFRGLRSRRSSGAAASGSIPPAFTPGANPPGGTGGAAAFGAPGGAGGPSAGGFGGPSGPGGFGASDASLSTVVRYAAAHGGGTVGVSSQSSAAAAILASNADVAGLGGFSGRESSVSVRWLAGAVSSGRLRWVIADQTQSFSRPGDTRQGSSAALATVARLCRAVKINSTSAGGSGSTGVTMYDCLGRSAVLLAAAGA